MDHYKKKAKKESVDERIDDEPLDPDEVQFQDDPRIMYMLKKGSPVPAYPQDALRIKTNDTEKFRDKDDVEEATEKAAEPNVKGKDYHQFSYTTRTNGDELSCRAYTKFTGDWFNSPTFIELKRNGQVVKTVETTRKGAKKVWRDFVDGTDGPAKS